MSFYSFIRGICSGILNLIFRIERIGTENIPKEGSYLFCSNHISFLDPIIIATIRMREFNFLAKEELVKIPVLGYIIKKLNVIPIKRGAGDIGAMRKSIDALKENKALIMFPEGTRSKDGKLQKGKDGVALIVKKSGCNVVPCAVVGKMKIFSKIKVVYGTPIDMTAYREEKDNKVITNAVMSEIKKLLDNN